MEMNRALVESQSTIMPTGVKAQELRSLNFLASFGIQIKSLCSMKPYANMPICQYAMQGMLHSLRL